jgi:hypothetical protein
METISSPTFAYAIDPVATTIANPDVLDTALYYSLFREAETVRWKMSDIPFEAIETDKAPAALVGLMRELAAAELTTWTATNQFFDAFRDDVDFTQWLTVWLYEETKHPQALMRWLKHFGESFDGALREYKQEVREGVFPAAEHSFAMDDAEYETLLAEIGDDA